MRDKNIDKSKINEIEIIISKFLRFGVILSAVVILIGLAMFLITGNSGYLGSSYPTTPKEIIKGLLMLKPYGIILTGLLILIFTPIFRVGVSIIVFAKERNYLYVKITTIVFIILIISFMLGKVG